jgi:hypothetical protein
MLGLSLRRFTHLNHMTIAAILTTPPGWREVRRIELRRAGTLRALQGLLAIEQPGINDARCNSEKVT